MRCAELGYRTVVLSTDAAHSLADSFDRPLGPEPVAIAPNLWGQETDIVHNIQKYWGRVRDWLAALLAWRGVEEMVAEELAILPGMEELANLLWINHHHDSGDYDVIIVDCAPTGEALRLLTFPEMARWWLEKMLPIQRRLSQLINPVIQRFIDMPLPDEQVLAGVEDIFRELARLRTLLTMDTTTVRLVLNPEKMVIKEAQRTFTYLNLYGYATDAVVCNRILPETVNDPYFKLWQETQKRYMQLVEECFSPLPILKAPLFGAEVVGLEALKSMAHSIFDQQDPAQVLFSGVTQRIERENGDYLLKLPLPFATRESVSLLQSGDELVVRIGNQKRNILLPHTLQGREAKEALIKGKDLEIRFS